MIPWRDPAVVFLALVLCADALALLLFFGAQARRRAFERRRLVARRLVLDALAPPAGETGPGPASRVLIGRRRRLVLEEAARVADSVSPAGEGRRALERLLVGRRCHARLFRDLRSNNTFRRLRAAALLPLFPSRAVVAPLVTALERERDLSVKLFLAAALARAGDAAAVPTIIDSLKDSPVRYQRAVFGILADFEGGLDDLLPLLTRRREREIKFLLIHLAGRQCPPLLDRYLERLAGESDLDIARAAFRVLSAARAESLDHERYLRHADFLIRNLAAESLGRIPRTSSLALLFDHLDDPVIAKSARLAITALIRARPHFLKIAMHRCLNERRPVARRALAETLAGFADYILGRLARDEEGLAGNLLFEFVRHGKTNEIINFLNRNSDEEIEHRIMEAVKYLLEQRSDLSGEFLKYLNRRILREHGLEVEEEAPTRPAARRERQNRPLLWLFFALGAFSGPVASLCLAAFSAGADFLRSWVHWFNSIFAVYATTLSGIYLVLLFFSALGARRQSRLAALPGMALLFQQNVLPSVSIISPAYNEEATIVESVRSLLNLRYPEYEVIVVNDGSTDGTLERLIASFELERTDVFIHGYLATQEIRGVYANKRWPGLLVVDKMNGGKADSLNAGINVARKEYFSGIDADSLLERDALLNMASLFIFSNEEVTAAGGNIFPANGCAVRGGDLLETRIPSGHLARFQTVEYLRAFMAGRIGWAELRLLLIISGAFGVFHRRSVINAGGYLTGSERFQKDTVGEDMELVVRLCRSRRESKTPFSMIYAHHANCWTEIPERLRTLVTQRDRWQRGLIDIVCFHARLLFNPAYGRVGLVGLPYFLLFEVLGPWIELEGFLVFIASLAAGWIGLPLVALVLAATVGLGFLMSVLSVSIAERRKEYFPLADKLKLFLYAVLENFGIRQFLNFLRIRGLVRMLAGTGGWGKMERRGWLGPGEKRKKEERR
jgi:cellulose synthase/poly-beta-1,6-N-acetylglucosamine synthase-like glycosyltransferase/HEAT repeat protein